MKTDGKTQKKAWVLLAAAMAMAVAPAAQAQLGAFGAVNATSGYPATVTDSTGLVLDLPAPVLGDGLNPPTMIFDPPGVGALEQAIGFATEAFYAYADNVFDTPAGVFTAVFGVEAAFLNGPAVNGDQMVFSRNRFRLRNVTVPGDYTIQHPFGSRTITVTQADIDAGVGLNFTQDIILWTLGATVTLNGNYNTFLKATTLALGVDPALWIGDGATIGTVTGSPTGFNAVRVTGPGIDVTSDNQWLVSGHIAQAAPPPPATGLVLSPAIGSTLTAATTTFILGPGPAGNTQQAVWIGSTVGAFDLAALFVPNSSFTVTLPTDGRTIHMRVWSQVGGVWTADGDVTFTAMTAAPSALLAPSPLVPMVGAVQNFVFDLGTGVAPIDHAIWVGSTLDGFDIAALFVRGNGQRVTVPTDGRTLFVKVWSMVNGTWTGQNYQFTAPVAP